MDLPHSCYLIMYTSWSVIENQIGKKMRLWYSQRTKFVKNTMKFVGGLEMKKWSILIISVLYLSIASIGFGAPKKDDATIFMYPKVGAVIFMDEGLRGDDKVLDQVEKAIQQKMLKEKNINYLNIGLMKAKFQEYTFRKNIGDGNNLYPYGSATLEQLATFGQENNLINLIVVEAYLKDVSEKQNKARPGEEIKSEFTSQVEIKVKVISPARGVIVEEHSFIADGKSSVAIKSYWSAATKSIGKMKSDWKVTFTK